MLGWLRKLTAVRADLPGDAERLLREHLAGLDALAGGLADRALRFVARGEDEAVVAELAARPDAGRALQLKAAAGVHALTGDGRAALFGALPPDAALHLRLALLWEAASRRARHPNAIAADLALPEWLQLWLWEASTAAPNTWRSEERAWAAHELVEGMLAAADAPADAALRAVLSSAPPTAYAIGRLATVLVRLDGFARAAARHPAAVADALGGDDAKHLAHVLDLAAKHGLDIGPHAPRVAELATASAKTVRARALTALRALPDGAEPHLRALAAAATTETRLHAVEALWELRGEAVRGFLAERLEADASPKVKSAISARLGAGPDPAAAPPLAAPALALPPLPPLPHGPLPAGASDLLRRLADDWHREGVENARRARAAHPQWNYRDPVAVTPAQHEAMIRYLTAPGTTPVPDVRGGGAWLLDERRVKAFLSQAGLDLVHAVRFLAVIGVADLWRDGLRQGHLVDRYLRHHRAAHRLSYGLREIAAALALCDVDRETLGRTAVNGWRRLFDWEPEAVWPYFVEHHAALEEALGLRALPDARAFLAARQQAQALEILGMLPAVPERFSGRLWELALGTAKSDRAAAQRCLARAPGARERILAALADGRQETRTVAAEWLGDLRDAGAVPALEAALRKEKHDAPRAALMGALEALGVEVDRFLDRPGLAKEAAKLVAKGTPDALAWFPFDALPPVRWADAQEAVPGEIVRAWVLQAHKLGSPEPGAVLRRYARQLEPRGREALGRAVLEAWLAEDVRPRTPAELDAAAASQAQYSARFHPNVPLPQLVAQLRAQLAQQPAGSAAGTKGVLALAGACAGADAAPLVQQYLKTWYGQRAAQCKALLQMLSWVDHPSAIQVVLATAARFRTAGIRKEAEACANAIAERRGWTVADLADRTIPSAGFDDDGALRLDYGGRAFTARLSDDLAIELVAEDGKRLAALPEPRSGDAEDAVAAAKAGLAAARKELKATLKLQGERLYEAMCTQRAWSADDWDRYLHRHPVVGRLCRRVIWEARLGDARVGTFRPMGDGTHTGAADEAFALPAGATVRIAHAATTPEAERVAWAEHLAAYEVAPLFDQLGRTPRRLPEGDAERTRIEDVRGHLVGAFKLRARATRLGYVRGPAEDGGWFHLYRKHFPTLGLEAVVEFSGNALPEEDRTVALHALYFARTSTEPGAGVDDELPLSDVPTVLLSECWNDLAAMAADGAGFDPDWQNKVNA